MMICVLLITGGPTWRSVLLLESNALVPASKRRGISFHRISPGLVRSSLPWGRVSVPAGAWGTTSPGPRLWKCWGSMQRKWKHSRLKRRIWLNCRSCWKHQFSTSLSWRSELIYSMSLAYVEVWWGHNPCLCLGLKTNSRHYMSCGICLSKCKLSSGTTYLNLVSHGR